LNRYDSTSAESVAVESRKQNDLPRIGGKGALVNWTSRLRPWELEDIMHAFGMLLLAAATAGDGFGYSDPNVGGKKWLRHHLVKTTHATEAPPYTAATLAGGGGMGGNNGRRFTVTKSQIYFLDPNGMQVGWQNGAGPNGERAYLPAQLTVPARYNFNQGYIYRLKLTNIPGRAGVSLYPSIEVAPTTPITDAYLAHNAIPVQFTNEDFDQVVDGGNFVTKVIYLPDPKYQELAVAGVETLVSTRLEPGIDPILEADKRGTILLIVRLGAIDLEGPPSPGIGSPIYGAPVGATVGGIPIAAPGTAAELPPGTLPPGVTVPPGNVTLDQVAPSTPAAPVPATPAPPTPSGVAAPPGATLAPRSTTPPPAPAPAVPAPVTPPAPK
jgi:hypothetical protein